MENEFRKKINIKNNSETVNNPEWTKFRKTKLAKFYSEVASNDEARVIFSLISLYLLKEYRSLPNFTGL